MSITTITPPAVPGIGGDAASAGGDSPAQQQSTALDGLDYNAFLKLLVAQLENQDPTEPMDNTQYMAQLASYANVEQNIRTNVRLNEVMTAVRASHADALIGRTVSSADGAISGVVRGYEMNEGGVVLLLEGDARLPFTDGVKVMESGA